MSREGRPKEKIPETRAEFRNRREEGETLEKALPVRFESLRLEENGASAGGPEEERSRSSRGVQEERPAISTPVGSDREQRRKRSPEGISGIRDVHPPPPASRREVSPGRSSARRMYPSPTESSEEEYDGCPRRSRGRKMEGRSYPLDQGSWTRDTIEKSGTGAGRRARETESPLASAGRVP